MRGWGSATKLHPSRSIGRGARVMVECTRKGGTIDIGRGRLSTAPWWGVVAIVWTRPRRRGRLERERERERERWRK